MRKLFSMSVVLLMLLFFVSISFAADAVTIVKPLNGANVTGPVKVCMEVVGVQVEPAKKGVNDGKGHHHILIDIPLPSNLGNAIGKDANHVHMGDGSTCKTLKLSSGKHTIRALFAKGNHVPYTPPLSDTIEITVK
ncbi:MAG: DUF4399 domain-containing protein [Nitrospinota bacterium]|nr:DUF4399 domain-containing protein [Nitrospinota bacterium]